MWVYIISLALSRLNGINVSNVNKIKIKNALHKRFSSENAAKKNLNSAQSRQISSKYA